MGNQSFSKIWIVVILLVLIAGGILAWQWWIVPPRFDTSTQQYLCRDGNVAKSESLGELRKTGCVDRIKTAYICGNKFWIYEPPCPLDTPPKWSGPYNINRLQEFKIDETANWKTYRNEEYGYEVKYPEDWDIEEQVIDSTPRYESIEKGVVIGPTYGYTTRIYNWGETQEKETELYDGAIFSIFIGKNPENLDLIEWVNKEKEVHEVYGYIVSKKEILLNNYSGIELTLEVTPEVEYIPYTIYLEKEYQCNEEYFFDKEGKIYKISLFAISRTNIERYRKAFNQILSSLRFLE